MLTPQEKLKQDEKLYLYEGDDRIVSSTEFIEEEDKEGLGSSFSVDTTFPNLSKLLFSGFRGGQLITITGPSGQGKTTFAQMLTRQFEEQGVFSTWFSYEVGASELIREFSKSKVFYLPRQMNGHSVQWLVERARESKLKHPDMGAIFIDTLDEVVSLERPSNYVTETEFAVSEIKQLSIELNIPIFQLAHLAKTREYNEVPTEADIKNSSSIYQKSDKVLMVWRQREKNRDLSMYQYTGKTLIIMNKNRQKGSMMTKFSSFHFNEESNELVEDANIDEIGGPNDMPSLSSPQPTSYDRKSIEKEPPIDL